MYHNNLLPPQKNWKRLSSASAKHMDFEKDKRIEVIKATVPPKTVDINIAAFEKGYELA